MLEFGEGREREQGGLTLAAFVGDGGLRNWSTAMNFPPPQLAAYTLRTRPGMARSTRPRMLASVGMPARFTCSSLGRWSSA